MWRCLHLLLHATASLCHTATQRSLDLSDLHNCKSLSFTPPLMQQITTAMTDDEHLGEGQSALRQHAM